MPEQPSIGVIIANYNYERYLPLALESVFAQRYAAAEIIVIDDGSSDRSREILESYGTRVRAVYQTNQGQVAARNHGYSLSSSDIIIFLDADDILLPEALERVAEIWHEGASKVQFDTEIIDGAGTVLGRRFCNFPDGYDAVHVKRRFLKTGTYIWPVTSGNAYGRAFLDHFMPMNPPHSQDGMLNTLAPLYGDVLTVPDVHGQYRLHGRNASRLQTGKQSKGYPDFPRRIAIRRAEFDVLRDHAIRLGVSLPTGNLLDSEFVFVNYRLMARRLRQSYDKMEEDSDWMLWWNGVRLGMQFRAPKAKLSHIVWMTAMLFSPLGLAEALITLRFNRGEMLAPLRKLLPALFPRPSPGKAG